MDNIRLHKYYRTSGYGLNKLIYRFLMADNGFKRLLHLNIHRGTVILLIFILAMIMAVCSITSLDLVTSNASLFQELLETERKKLPRMESVVSIIPSYRCIHNHLQRMSVFQEKMKKILYKEHLDLEIMNSKMSCIGKLLKPEIQSEWHYSRSPKIYYRSVNGITSEK